MAEKWLLDYTLEDALVDEVSMPYRVASKLVKLFADGKEVAYVARYRGDAHEGMSCDKIRQSFRVFTDVNDINKKVERAIHNVSTKTSSEDERKFAMERLKSARDLADVIEVTQLYATSRKTKATIAREMGLEEVARDILEGKRVNLSQLVGSRKELTSLKIVEENTGNAMADLLNKMPETLEAVKKITSLEAKVTLSVCCELSNKARKWTSDDKSIRLISNFNDYLNFKKDVRKVENYQILAMERGEENDVLTWKVEVCYAEKEHPGNKLRVAPAHWKLFQAALNDSINRLFIPRIKRSIRNLDGTIPLSSNQVPEAYKPIVRKKKNLQDFQEWKAITESIKNYYDLLSEPSRIRLDTHVI